MRRSSMQRADLVPRWRPSGNVRPLRMGSLKFWVIALIVRTTLIVCTKTMTRPTFWPVCESIRLHVVIVVTKVAPVATMLTPNDFEAKQLTGRCIETEADALQACLNLHGAGPSKVVITSLSLNNMLTVIGSHVQSKGKPPKQFRIVLPKLHSYFTGTGDLMTALLLGWSHKFPDDLDKAAELAVNSLQAVLKNTIADYGKAGTKPKTKQLELRLIQSVKAIQSPEITFLTKQL